MANNPTHPSPPRPGARVTALAIGAAFFVNGATLSSWTPRLPELQADLGISDAALGVTLVGMGIGGLASSMFSGWLVDRRGSRTMTMTTSAAMSLWLPLLGFAPTAVLVFAALIVLGALDGLTDVAMNSQAVELQHRVGMSIITRFHALWSAGAVTGGIVASRAAAAGISLQVQLAVTGVVLAVMTLVAARWLLPDRAVPHVEASEGPGPRASRPVLVRLFLVGMAIALAELPPNDWSALMMSERFDVTAGQAGLGFVAVAGGMLVGRLVGDHTTDRLGLERTRRGGAALAAIGVVLAATVPSPVAAGCGFFVAGLGLSSLFPLLFRAASELTHGSHSGMASFSAGARLGFLCASPLMGIVAERTTIATALVLVAGVAAAVVAVSRLPRVAVRELEPGPL
jgi:predicted MFS family arabinose efflux permease